MLTLTREKLEDILQRLESILPVQEVIKLHEDKVSKIVDAVDDSDAWTLGSGDVIETDKVEISIEEVNKSIETNIKAAGDARKYYADTVKAITEDPEHWAGNLGVKQGATERRDEKMGLTTFDEIIEVVLKHEGGYVDDPDDRGGATNLGITQGTLSQFRENDVTKDDVRDLTVEEAKECYFEMFWQPSQAEKLPEEVRHLYFDMVVNHGQGNAVKILQMACKGQGDDIAVDGGIGPNTIRAAADIEEWELLCERIGFYWNLVFDGSRYQKRNSQAKFIRGWVRRAFSFLLDD